jgi:putative hydrolase of the HAD superfamily
MRMMAVIRAVLFDYGLVLTGPPDPAAKERMRALLGADEHVFHAAYWRQRHEYDRGTVTGPVYWHEIGMELGRTLDEREIAELIEHDVTLWTQPNLPMIDWAGQLRRSGLRTGVLSNLGDAMEHGVRQKFAWMEEFDHHTFSHRLRVIKPEAAIYAHAIEGLGLRAEEVLFVDDREENVAAARTMGLHAVRYGDHAEFVKELREARFEDLLLPDALS